MIGLSRLVDVKKSVMALLLYSSDDVFEALSWIQNSTAKGEI